jgi:predicted chitinase
MDKVNILISDLNAVGIRNKYLINGIVAVLKEETALIPSRELSYSKTDSTRLKSIFPSTLKNLELNQIDILKKNNIDFFSTVYGKLPGNIRKEDGYIYRGSGLNQLTGKANFEFYAKQTGLDLVAKPDLLLNFNNASKVASLFFLNGLNSGLKLGKFKKYGVSEVSDINTYDKGINVALQINAGLSTPLTSDFFIKVKKKIKKMLSEIVDNKGKVTLVVFFLSSYLLFKNK